MKDISIFFLIFQFINCVRSQTFTISIECIENCLLSYKTIISKPVVLEANCRKKCTNVEYNWKVHDIETDKEVIFKENQIEGQNDSRFVIKPEVLLPAKKYKVILEGKKGDEVHNNSFKLNMQPCSDQYPCTTSTTVPATPEEILENIETEISELETLDKKSVDFELKQENLLETLVKIPLDKPELIKKTTNTLLNIFQAGNLKLTPRTAKLAIKAIGQIADAKLDMIKKSRKPTELKKDAEDLFQATTDTFSYTINDNESVLINHRKEVEVNTSITEPFIFTENYPLYDDFDLDFLQKKNNVKYVSENVLGTVKKVTRSLALTMQQKAAKLEEFVNADTCALIIIDKPNQLRNKNFSTCNVTINISTYLAKELEFKMDWSFISLAVLKVNPFWWKINIITPVIVFEIRKDAHTDLIPNLENSINLNFKLQRTIQPEIVNGVVKLLKNETNNNFSDKIISVHQLFVTKRLKTLMIQFPGLKDNDKLQVVIYINYRPSLEDFKKSMKIVTGNKNMLIENIFIPADSFCYVGILPTKETILKSGELYGDYWNYSYGVQFSQLSCNTWNEITSEWIDDYCHVDQSSTTATNLLCNCLHMSTYGGFVLNIESKTDEIANIDFILERQYNYVILITIFVNFLVYIFALLFVIWRNRKRKRPKFAQFLLDNNLGYEFEYLVTVYTGTYKNSGTTANIVIKLEGIKGDTDFHLLRVNSERILQKGSVDCFLLLTAEDLGNLMKLTIWTDCYGIRSSWYCKKIIISNLRNQQEFLFDINKWLSVLNHTVYCIINVSRTEILIPTTKWDYAMVGLKEKHLLFSLFRKQQRVEQIGSVEKIHLIYYILASIQFFLLLMYAPPTTKLYGQLGAGHYHFHFTDFVYAIVTTVIVFIFSYGFIYLFQILLGLLTSVNIFILLIFGLWTNFITSLIWLTSFLISLLIWIFLFESTRVIIEAILKREKLITETENEMDLSKIEEEKRKLWTQFGEKSMRPLFGKQYQPLSEIEIQIKREEELQRIELRTMVVDIVMFFIYLIIMLCIILINKDNMSHHSSRNIKKMFITDEYVKNMTFYEIDSQKAIMRYFRETFIPVLYTTNWYGNWTTNEPGLTIDFNTKMLGIPRIRQIRIENHTCSVPDGLRFLTNYCHSEYSSSIENKNDYNPRWSKDEQYRTNESSDSIWLYQDGWKSESSIIIGELAIYPSGGYITPLGRTKENTELILNYLESTNWFDQQTRAIFIEVCLYNANQNLFNILNLIIERSATEKFIKSYSIQTSKLLFLYDELAIGTIILLVLFIVILIIFSWKKIQQLKETYISTFFSDIWNIIDLLIITFAFGFILMNYLRSRAVGDLLNKLQDSNHNEFVSFMSALYWDYFTTIIATVLVAISTIRVWKLLRFLRMFRLFELTLVLAAKYLFAMIFYGFIIMFAFSATGHVIFGGQSEDFRTIGQSFLSLLVLAFGFHQTFNFDVLEESYASIGFFYYFTFMTTLLMAINLFIAIIVFAYETAKIYFDESDQEKLVSYNMYNFLMDEFRYYCDKSNERENWTKMRAGADEMEQQYFDLKSKPDAARKTFIINQKRMITMHKITERSLEILQERRRMKGNIRLDPDNKDYIAEIVANFISEEEEDEEQKRDESENEIYTVIPCEDVYQFCSNKRINDMVIIVQYLIDKHVNKKSDKPLSSGMIDKQTAMLISLNHTILQIIRDLEKVVVYFTQDKSTMVTFEDLGFELEDDDDDDNDNNNDE